MKGKYEYTWKGFYKMLMELDQEYKAFIKAGFVFLVITQCVQYAEKYTILAYPLYLCIVYILAKIIHKDKSYNAYNYNNPSFDNAYFTNNECISSALTKYLNDSSKEKLLTDLIDSDIDLTELYELMESYHTLSIDCWRTKKVITKSHDGLEKNVEIKERTEEEYEEALSRCKKSKEDLQKYIKDFLKQ